MLRYKGAHQFGYTALYVVVQILNYSREKRPWYLRALLFLWGTLIGLYHPNVEEQRNLPILE
jgi:hypothetical protein